MESFPLSIALRAEPEKISPLSDHWYIYIYSCVCVCVCVCVCARLGKNLKYIREYENISGKKNPSLSEDEFTRRNIWQGLNLQFLELHQCV